MSAASKPGSVQVESIDDLVGSIVYGATVGPVRRLAERARNAEELLERITRRLSEADESEHTSLTDDIRHMLEMS